MRPILGTIRLIYEDSLWFIGKLLLLYITLPLTVAWIVVGITLELEDTVGVISGPAFFFFIPAYGIMGFKSLLSIAISLGSTRSQLLKSFYGVGIASVALYFFIVNILQLLLQFLYDQGISKVSLGSSGRIFLGEYHFAQYLLVDLMLGLLLFGAAFLIYCISYRLGMTRSLIGCSIVLIALMFLYYSGVLDGPVEWVSSLNLNAMTGITIAGAAGVAAMLITYPMMRNAPLTPKGNRE